mgnify:CR=1 FL=1
MTPLGNCESKIINRGFDVGLFAGPTTALMGPFSTRNYLINDYTTMAFQFGLAAFIESNVASFGLATGFDYLFNKDRSSWVYLHQPWVGFIVGVALN